ncbi:MAG: tRNA pseudouridine(38-40) synthase TruA [bacterium]
MNARARPPINLKLTIEYDGGGYHGWQYQANRPTVQAELQAAAGRLNGAPTVVHGCSRTDAGVSARNYVANFTATRQLPCERWRRALNQHLPPAIHVKLVEPAPPGFHARFSARGKLYRYRIVRGHSPLRHARAWELRYPVDLARIRRAAAEFVGTRDFRPLCQARDATGTCTVRGIEVNTAGDEIEIAVTGDRFLYKMVRRIVGAAVTYGAGRLTLADIRAALAGRPGLGYRTAPAQGLTLDRVEYD